MAFTPCLPETGRKLLVSAAMSAAMAIASAGVASAQTQQPRVQTMQQDSNRILTDWILTTEMRRAEERRPEAARREELERYYEKKRLEAWAPEQVVPVGPFVRELSRRDMRVTCRRRAVRRK